jgi:hypothetical protein
MNPGAARSLLVEGEWDDSLTKPVLPQVQGTAFCHDATFLRLRGVVKHEA